MLERDHLQRKILSGDPSRLRKRPSIATFWKMKFLVPNAYIVFTQFIPHVVVSTMLTLLG
jgi:hypothetical protein